MCLGQLPLRLICQFVALRGDRKLLTLLLLGFSLGIWASVDTGLHDAILTLALELVLEFVLELAHAGVLVVDLHAFRAIATL